MDLLTLDAVFLAKEADSCKAEGLVFVWGCSMSCGSLPSKAPLHLSSEESESEEVGSISTSLGEVFLLINRSLSLICFPGV